MQPGYFSEVKGAQFVLRHRWDGDQMIEIRSFKTPVGTATQEVMRDPGGVGSEHIRKHYITDKDDYRVVKYLVENTVLRSNEQEVQTKIDDLGDDGIVIGRMDRNPYQKCLIELAGPERFLMDLYTDPEPALELMDAIDRKMDEAFGHIEGTRAEVIWQPDNVTADMTPPDAFTKYCLPFYEKHGAEARRLGKPYMVHMDGRIGALADLVARAAFDVIESFSLPDMGGDLTWEEAIAAFPDKVIVPNFPSNWCTKGSEEIERLLEDLLRAVGKGVPFMLQVSEDIPTDQWQRVLPIVAGCVKK